MTDASLWADRGAFLTHVELFVPSSLRPLARRGAPRPPPARAPHGPRALRTASALHLALDANDADAAAALIETSDAAALNTRSSSRVTPLLMLTMGRCTTQHAKARCEQLIWRVLERGGGASIAVRTKARLSAADHAERHQLSPRLVAHLRALEAAERARTAGERCEVCGDVFAHNKVAYAARRVASGEEENAMLLKFFSTSYHHKLLDPALHKLNELRTVRKELTESLAVLSALEDTPCSGGGPLSTPTRWHVVDIACGRGLTASLAALRYAGARVTAVDLNAPHIMPHWERTQECRVSYLQQDILGPAFLDAMARLEAESSSEAPARRDVAMLGMHLCGELSLRAIDAFELCRSAAVLVLSPCCLPAKGSEHAPDDLFASNQQIDQYHSWSAHLETLLRGRGYKVTRSVEKAMLSVKNVVLVATKVPKGPVAEVVLRVSLADDLAAACCRVSCDIQFVDRQSAT
ncbi:hypothetical protein AB1Y20_000277 [Prymnesium parvum]|uniref:Methyltransferase domain-containing protein n=1 Tax=Prymnesium parvum TaxID=97485 RepID=A0AB34K457_PRYPA